jgi:DNA-binding NarL/FixJ family response regulator
MRRSLRALLAYEPGLEVVAETGELPGLIQQVVEHDADAVVIDMSFPGGGSLRVIRHLRWRLPGLSIVATGLDENMAFWRAAVEAGARAYVPKQKADLQLPQAIRGSVRERRARAAS